MRNIARAERSRRCSRKNSPTHAKKVTTNSYIGAARIVAGAVFSSREIQPMPSIFRRPSRIAAVLFAIGAVVWLASREIAPPAEERPASDAAKIATPAVPVQRVAGIDAAAERHQ